VPPTHAEDLAEGEPPVTTRNDDFRVPVPELVKERMREFGRDIKKRCPAGWGFTLLMFSYGADGAMVYLSSAEREDMLKALQEFLQKQAS
jgi:hypothetical protein